MFRSVYGTRFVVNCTIVSRVSPCSLTSLRPRSTYTWGPLSRDNARAVRSDHKSGIEYAGCYWWSCQTKSHKCYTSSRYVIGATIGHPNEVEQSDKTWCSNIRTATTAKSGRTKTFSSTFDDTAIVSPDERQDWYQRLPKYRPADVALTKMKTALKIAAPLHHGRLRGKRWLSARHHLCFLCGECTSVVNRITPPQRIALNEQRWSIE